MQRKHVISLCILLCALAVLVAFRPSADETVPLTGSASAGLILLDGQSGGYYVLVCYFVITIVIILLNIRSLPGVFERIIQEAFGIRQAAAGGFGAVLCWRQLFLRLQESVPVSL